MKKFLRGAVAVIAVVVLLFETGLFITGNGYVNKVLAMTIFDGKLGPDLDELNLFPYHEVDIGKPIPWPHSASYNKHTVSADLQGQLAGYQTVAFLVIRNDSLLHEQYREGYNEHTVSNSFSMAKSVNAVLIGCALKDGYLSSLDQPVSDFLPEFKVGEKAGITIRHLLTMSSGLDFKEEYVSPFAWPAEAYYGPDVNALTLRAPVKEKPGIRWHYKGGDSQLLGMILRKATGIPVAEYAAERLWKPLGAEDKAFWSTDEQGMEKVSCCFYTNARDFARIASLFLHYGRWNGVQLVDSEYVAASVTPAALLNREDKPSRQYGFQWWLTTYHNHAVWYMRGIRGQYVFAIPDLNLVAVRFGHKRAPKAGDDLPADVFVYLDAAMEVSGNK